MNIPEDMILRCTNSNTFYLNTNELKDFSRKRSVFY